MQELFAQLFWGNEDVSHAVVCLCEDIPGYHSAKTAYEQVLSQVREQIGFELCDQLLSRLTECSSYEAYAYYAVGLGLRDTIFRALCG